MNAKNLFFELYGASSEDEVEEVISKNSSIFDKSENWRPLGGNKNEIHFVQGKYNMDGSDVIVFCGKKGF